ncbi:MAG: hypothetical protein ABIY37_03440 [Devosia sp.]
MFRLAVAFSLFSAMALPALAGAQFPIPLRFVTTDGTWDCKDASGAPLGTVVALGAAYGVIGTDDKVIGYGDAFRMGEEQYDLPHYIFRNGYLKDELGFVGMYMRGPKEDYENFSTGIFLALFRDDASEVECTRRLVPGKLQ